jgi:hypothetical protein
VEVRVALATALQQEMVQVTLCELSIESVENLKKLWEEQVGDLCGYRVPLPFRTVNFFFFNQCVGV